VHLGKATASPPFVSRSSQLTPMIAEKITTGAFGRPDTALSLVPSCDSCAIRLLECMNGRVASISALERRNRPRDEESHTRSRSPAVGLRHPAASAAIPGHAHRDRLSGPRLLPTRSGRHQLTVGTGALTATWKGDGADAPGGVASRRHQAGPELRGRLNRRPWAWGSAGGSPSGWAGPARPVSKRQA
jgi:hypothetical protein